MSRWEKLRRNAVGFVYIDLWVLGDPLLRTINSEVDFGFMNDVAEKLCREDNGCLYVNPVILLIIVLILHLYGIFSLYRMMQGTQIYITYRCFGGYTLDEGLSHISTVCYPFVYRGNRGASISMDFAGSKRAGYLGPKSVFVKGMYIKENTNINRKEKCHFSKLILIIHYTGFSCEKNPFFA